MQTFSLFQLLFAGLFGMGMGVAYFAVLWLTVSHLHRFPWPATLVLFSLLLRMGALLAGLLWIGDGRWPGVVTALLGFILVRLWCIRYLRQAPQSGKTAGQA